MFDITKEQLKQFSAEHLRELVARLCEAEMRSAGAPVSAVSWGGSQTAPDEGLDVECIVENDGFAGDFVPRARTGIQVKKPKMPVSKIAKEMSPDGVLRPVFLELARHNGCYIIVSLDDDPTGMELVARKNAMQSQIEAIKDQGDLQTKFYGCSELANWLRQHPGVQLWVREKLGLPLNGWRPFGRWSTTPPGVEDDLICETGVSITLPGRERNKLDVAQGIDGIRELIRNSGTAVRIVGLSGVGKSRIVQALFEESVGNEPLSRNLAIYVDLGEMPNPSAREVLDRLIADRHSAIMVLDNCPSDTHNMLAGYVPANPDIHLITVEYDIREDKPEATSVIRIDAVGTAITETLIKRRHPDLNQVNIRRIAEFSGGNARLALALAGTVNEKVSLSDFSNEQLFSRLFFQRGEPDANLVKAAEVLALVYSFSISPDEIDVDELATLAGLLDWDRLELHRATQVLVDRQLAQKRGNWRALLPPAVSNRLAAAALSNIPVGDILSAFQGLPNARLLKSFGKRIGYLHDHEVSQDIVKKWILPDGLLHDLRNLNEDYIQLLTNVAPVAPEGVLSVIEAQDAGGTTEIFFSRENPHIFTFAKLLTALAYDPVLFERCVTLLAKFVLTESEGENNNIIQDRLFSLFSLNLSGTEADPEARKNIARRFLLSEDRNEQRLGLGMLRAALQSRAWSSIGSFEFGARPRSYGYEPKTHEEEDQWFMRFLALAQEIATAEDVDLSAKVRDLLANELRDLWDHPGLRLVLAAMVRVINDNRPWLEGWQVIRLIKHYDYRGADGDELLNELDEVLRPRQLSDKVRTYVLSAVHNHVVYEGYVHDDNQKLQEFNRPATARAYDLGVVVADEPRILDELSQDLFTAQNGYLTDFGKGMASKSNDPQALWERLLEYLKLAGDQARRCDILSGVLKGIHERDEPFAQKILDEAVQSRILRKFIVNLQLSIPLGRTSVERLLRSLDFEDTPSWQFGSIAWHRPIDALSEEDVRDLMLRILDRPDGAEAVLDGLGMRLNLLENDELTLGPDLKRVGLVASAKLLRHTANQHDGGQTDHRVSDILKSCMDEAELPIETSDVLNAYFDRVKASYPFMDDMHQSAAVLAEKETLRFLDGIFFDPDLKDYHRLEVFKEHHDMTNVLSNVDIAVLLDWCQKGDFQERLGMISEAIFPFEKEPEDDRIVLSEQAHAIIDATQDPTTVLRNFSSFIEPRGWSGSLANIIAKQCQAFETLLNHDRSDISAAAEMQIYNIKKWEDRERQRERADDEQREQRFE